MPTSPCTTELLQGCLLCSPSLTGSHGTRVTCCPHVWRLRLPIFHVPIVVDLPLLLPLLHSAVIIPNMARSCSPVLCVSVAVKPVCLCILHNSEYGSTAAACQGSHVPVAVPVLVGMGCACSCSLTDPWLAWGVWVPAAAVLIVAVACLLAQVLPACM